MIHYIEYYEIWLLSHPDKPWVYAGFSETREQAESRIPPGYCNSLIHPMKYYFSERLRNTLL